MDFEDEELMEEKSFKAGGENEEDPLLAEDLDDEMGAGPDADFDFQEEEEEEGYGSGDGY